MISRAYQSLAAFARAHGFRVTSTTGGRHNVGSAHYEGRAVDVSVQGKTQRQIAVFARDARVHGYVVRNEITHPHGQKVWHGAHLHLEVPRGGAHHPHRAHHHHHR